MPESTTLQALRESNPAHAAHFERRLAQVAQDAPEGWREAEVAALAVRGIVTHGDTEWRILTETYGTPEYTDWVAAQRAYGPNTRLPGIIEDAPAYVAQGEAIAAALTPDDEEAIEDAVTDAVLAPTDALVNALGFVPDEPLPACEVCHVWPGHDVPAHVAAVKAEVNEMIADGFVPSTVRTFSELHDYTDANMLRGLGDSLYSHDLDGIPTDRITVEMDRAHDALMAPLTDMANAITDEVSEWLATGRTDAPLTPERALRALRAYVVAHSDGRAYSAVALTDIYLVGWDDQPSARLLSDEAEVFVEATPEGWLLDDEPATTKGGRPLALTDIYLVGWEVLRRLQVTYQTIERDA